MNPDAQYWAAIAQVLPVIAVALVIEVREIAKRWTDQTPAWVRRVQSVVWAGTLFAMALGAGVALRALRGVEPGTWWIAVSEAAVAIGFATIAISPGLEFVLVGFAEWLGRALAWHPYRRFRNWLLIAKTLRNIRIVGDLLAKRQLLIYTFWARLTEVERVINLPTLAKRDVARLGPRGRGRRKQKEPVSTAPTLEEVRQRIAYEREDLWKITAKAREQKRKYEADRADYIASVKECRRSLWERAAVERDEVVALVRASVSWSEAAESQAAEAERSERRRESWEGGPAGTAGPLT